MIEALTKALLAAAPIHGVSIGRRDDKATWRIDFKDDATPLQQLAAQTVLNNFDPDAPEPAAVPTRVPMMNFKIALLRAGLLGDVELAVPSFGAEAVLAWDYSATITRTHPLVAACAGALSVTEEQLDQLFTAAADVSPE